MNGQIRLTEQGEVIASKYAHPEIGRRNLETLVAATLEATLLHPTKSAPKAFLDAAAEISAASMAAYRKLVYETPGFTDYFFAATPIREIAELNIGSRPASRKATRRIEDLRAIPWGFSWGQCRVALPGWCGFGSAIEQSASATAAEQQRKRARWRCCRRCTSSGRSSARCCPTSTWCWPRATCASPRAMSSWSKTGAWPSASSPHPGRVAAHRRGAVADHRRDAAPGLEPALARSIEHRFPYLDPLNHLQVELMRRYRRQRDGDAANERVQRGIHISINGIAAGLRNTG